MANKISEIDKKQVSSATELGGIPVLILKEGTRRSRGKEAQSFNITAAKAVAEAVRSTLGPKGMDKMLVNSMGDVVVTGDGATILKEMDIEHPAAKMIVEVAKAQDEEVGDGTTTAAVLTGELLKNAQELFEQNVHPAVIEKGFRLAAEKSKEILETIAMKVSPEQEDVLLNIATTAIKGRETTDEEDKLAQLAVRAVKAVADASIGSKVDAKEIKVEKKEGGSIDDSELVLGIILDKERESSGMPKKVENARILLLNKALEIKKTETKAEIEITAPEQMQTFLDQEESLLKEMVKKIDNTGANVVFCQKGMDDLVAFYLAKSNIFAVKNVSEKDMEKLSRATGAKVFTDLVGISDSDIGKAGFVEEKKIGDKGFIFIRECANPKSVSVLLRGGTKHVTESIETTFNDAVRVVGVALEDGRYVAGGGSPEIEVALRQKEYAASLPGREQLAAYKFAESLEIIPKTLAENAGLDPINMLVEMRSQHELGNKNAGLNVYEGKIIDMAEKGIIEPLRVKVHAIKSATEAAAMMLRIDDVIAAGKEKLPETPPMPEEY